MRCDWIDQKYHAMFVFKSSGHEADFRHWHAKQLQQHDGVVLLVNWPMCFVGLRTIWRFRKLRSLAWLAVITAVFVAERASSLNYAVFIQTEEILLKLPHVFLLLSLQVIPSWIFLRHRRSYLQHRALVLGFVRICIVITTVAYLDVWHQGINDSNRKVEHHSACMKHASSSPPRPEPLCRWRSQPAAGQNALEALEI